MEEVTMASKWQRWKNIQKCYPFEEKRLAKWPTPYIVQPKFDGVRCRAIPLMTGPRGNEYLLLSSEENVIYSTPHINEALSNIQLRAELDGELYCHGMSFEEILSITSRTINFHHNFKEIKFHVFDIVNDQPQMRRQLLVDALRGLHPYIAISPFWLCESLEDIMRVFDKVIELGYEGIIVRHNMAPYQRKRSTLVMKFKPKKEDEYVITGYKEETSARMPCNPNEETRGVLKDSLGSLQCKSGDGNIFSVGTGFSDELRARLWQDRENLIGKVAKVKYQHITSGRKVPRFPVFVEVIENE
jgi:DNA ligase-1